MYLLWFEVISIVLSDLYQLLFQNSWALLIEDCCTCCNIYFTSINVTYIKFSLVSKSNNLIFLS